MDACDSLAGLHVPTLGKGMYRAPIDGQCLHVKDQVELLSPQCQRFNNFSIETSADGPIAPGWIETVRRTSRNAGFKVLFGPWQVQICQIGDWLEERQVIGGLTLHEIAGPQAPTSYLSFERVVPT